MPGTMAVVDFAMTVGAFVLPPIVILASRNRLRGFAYATLFFWMMLVAGSQYHLAFTPDYDSFAPALSITVGWIPATIYSGICFGIIEISKFFLDAVRSHAGRGGPKASE